MGEPPSGDPAEIPPVEVPRSDPAEVARRLALLPERAMRCARLRDIVLACEPAEAAWLLDSLATAGRAGGPPFDVSLLAAVDLASGDRLTYEERRAIFEAARAHRLDSCKELLFSDEVLDLDPDAPRALTPGTRPLTLGERKSLARSWRRDVLERLITDPHADVVGLLLGNSRVTEDDILRIATSRRSSASVLLLVLQSRRFAVRPRIRRALIRNPHLPLSSSLRLVGLLDRRELHELATDHTLHPSLHRAIVRRLRPVS